MLAHGAEDVMPSIPGFADLWASLVFHCVYCHGYEMSDRPLALLLGDDRKYNDMAVHQIVHKFHKITQKIYVLDNGIEVDEAINEDHLQILKLRNIPLIRGKVIHLIRSGPHEVSTCLLFLSKYIILIPVRLKRF